MTARSRSALPIVLAAGLVSFAIDRPAEAQQ
jgi:hypothetical protein